MAALRSHEFARPNSQDLVVISDMPDAWDDNGAMSNCDFALLMSAYFYTFLSLKTHGDPLGVSLQFSPRCVQFTNHTYK
jgi:hypothetical protein